MKPTLNDFLIQKKHIVGRVIKKMNIPPSIVVQDLFTVGMSAIFFTFVKGINFDLTDIQINRYLYICIKREIIDFMREESFEKKSRKEKKFEKSEYNDELHYGEYVTAESYTDFRIIKNQLNTTLKGREKKTFKLLLDGWGERQRDIATELGVHESSISLYKRSIKKQLINYVEV